jgi:ferredoxin like protein
VATAPAADLLRDDDARDATTARAAARSPVPVLPDVAFEDRIGTVEFRVHPRAHIVVDGDACRGCTTRACVTVCPANLFVPTADGGILFNYEQCVECGSCYMVCDTAGALSWSYPEGGHGVVYRRA